MLITTIGYVLAGLVGAGIIFVGVRFLLAPRAAAAGYGIAGEPERGGTGAYLSVKGVRDIGSGLIVLALIANGAPHALGWALLAATVMPIGDGLIVLRNHGPRATVFGVHWATAAGMLVTVALLLASPA